MKKTVLAFGTALLLAAPTLGYASSGNTNPNSAKSAAPGQLQKSPGGASDISPGQKQKSPGQASDLAPGHNKDKTGSTTSGAKKQ